MLAHFINHIVCASACMERAYAEVAAWKCPFVTAFVLAFHLFKSPNRQQEQLTRSFASQPNNIIVFVLNCEVGTNNSENEAKTNNMAAYVHSC